MDTMLSTRTYISGSLLVNQPQMELLHVWL